MIAPAEIAEALPVIGSLIVIEGLLSVDNALAIAAIAAPLPVRERRRALQLGIVGAYLFRGLALLAASWIIANPWVKAAGAFYLVYLMCSHLTARRAAEGERTDGPPEFWSVFFSIQIVDISLSLDNVVAAVALSPKLWVVYSGVFIGILVLRFFAGRCIGLIERFPILAHAAFVLVGYVGFLLLGEVIWGVEIGTLWKAVGIVCILAASIGYERSPGAQRGLAPLFGLLRGLMTAVALANPRRWRRG